LKKENITSLPECNLTTLTVSISSLLQHPSIAAITTDQTTLLQALTSSKLLRVDPSGTFVGPAITHKAERNTLILRDVPHQDASSSNAATIPSSSSTHHQIMFVLIFS
jgi:hypothetical protein